MKIPTLPPVIEKLILNEEWAEIFDPVRTARGRKLFKDNKVDFLECNAIENSLFYFELDVRGSHVYEVTISLDNHLKLFVDCSCPDFERCKHTAAAFFEIRKILVEQTLSPKKEVPSKISVDHWLKSLDTSLTEEAKISDASENDFAPSYKDRVLYFISAKYNGDIQLTARKGRILKDGGYSLTKTAIKRHLHDYNKPKYISAADLKIINYMDSVSDDYYNNSIQADSPHFNHLIRECAQTNRLIIDTLSHEKGKVYFPYTYGEERQLTPGWKPSKKGALKPTCDVKPPITSHLDCTPKIYIDTDRMEIGPLLQSHSDSFLSNWLKGPEIPPQELAKVSALLQKHQPETSAETSNDEVGQLPSKTKSAAVIPLPPEQKILSSLNPLPTLTVQRQDLTAKVSFLTQLSQPMLIGEVSFNYGGIHIPHSSPSENYSTEKEGTLYVVERDLKAEAKWLKQLTKLELHEAASLFSEKINAAFTSSYLFNSTDSINTSNWLNFLASHTSPLEKKGWLIETIGDLGYTMLEFDDIYEELEDRDNDWFKFDLGITFEGKKISLIPAIAAAMASGMYKGYDFPTEPDARIPIPLEQENHFINFPAGRFKEILEKIQDLFQHINDRGEIEVPRLRAATLVDDLDLARSNKTLQDLANLGKKLKNVKGLPKTRVPKNLQAELRDYQIEGFRWLQFLAAHQLNGVLADDMGLGKTLQALTHILTEKNSKRNAKLPTLVIAPTSVIPNWRNEAAKFTPTLKVLLLHGSERKDLFSQIPKHDIVITSYALLQRDQETHLKQHYHIVVLDESQYIKNAAAKTTKVANQLHANHRVCLSGTPMENHLGELWSTFNFLMPGLLQSNKSFNSTFRYPIERHADTSVQTSLHRRVGPLLLRRTKDVVAKELPPKTIIPHYITLNDEQVDLYESVRATMDKRVRDAIKSQGLSKSHILILDALLKLRQICCHPQLLKLEAAKKVKSSAKLDYLTELLGTLIEEERRILIFSQFTTMLNHIEKHLKKNNIPFVKITGATKDRQTPVEKFQKGEIPVFLISLKAGGTGLNLTTADTVIHYDPWWNPAAENQATDRAYRIGQKNAVFVHKLICQGTIEEHIQLLQEKKAKLVESLLSGSTNKLTLDQETLGGLLAPLE